MEQSLIKHLFHFYVFICLFFLLALPDGILLALGHRFFSSYSQASYSQTNGIVL
jgi:hypothetical protein